MKPEYGVEPEYYAEIMYNVTYRNRCNPEKFDYGINYSFDTRHSSQDFNSCLKQVSMLAKTSIEILEAQLLKELQAAWAEKFWEPINVAITSIKIIRCMVFKQEDSGNV